MLVSPVGIAPGSTTSSVGVAREAMDKGTY